MATNQGFKSLVPDESRLDSKFLYHWLKSKTLFLQNLGNGATFKEISKAVVERIEIPLPALPEQRRIAAVLDKADALRRKRKRALDLVGTFTRSIFLEMFGDPIANPKGWACKSIGEVCDVVTGNTPSRNQPEYYGNFIEWIKSDNINPPKQYVTRATEFLSLSGRAAARVAPAGSTLITCIAGSPNSIGNSAMTNREVAFNQQINALVPKQLDKIFLFHQIRAGKRLVQEASTGGMKGLVSKSRLANVRVLCPPLELQVKFAARAACAATVDKHYREHFDHTASLFSSLQYRAFSGQL